MDPAVVSLAEKNGLLKFTLSGVDVSIANAIRRIIISDIPPSCSRRCHMKKKQLLLPILLDSTMKLLNTASNVPIHITDDAVNLEDYEMVLDKTNTSDTTLLVTTKDFKIRNTKLNRSFQTVKVRKYFHLTLSLLTSNLQDLGLPCHLHYRKAYKCLVSSQLLPLRKMARSQ